MKCLLNAFPDNCYTYMIDHFIPTELPQFPEQDERKC